MISGGGSSGLPSAGHDVLRVRTIDDRRNTGELGGGVGENCGESLRLLNKTVDEPLSVLFFFNPCVETNASAQLMLAPPTLFTSGTKSALGK